MTLTVNVSPSAHAYPQKANTRITACYQTKSYLMSNVLDLEVNFNNAQNVPMPWKSVLFNHL